MYEPLWFLDFLEMHRKVLLQRICVCTCIFSSRQLFRKTVRTSIFCERVALFLLIGAEPWQSCPHTCSRCCTVPVPPTRPASPVLFGWLSRDQSQSGSRAPRWCVLMIGFMSHTQMCLLFLFFFFFLHFKWVPLKYKISFFDPGETILSQ